MTKPNQSETIVELQAAITGIQKRFAGQTLTLGATSYTVAALVALFQSLITAMAEAAAAKVAAHDAVAKVTSLEAQVMPVYSDLHAYVASTLGRSAAVLADFGPVPKARKVPDAATKAAALQKRKATRAANAAKALAKATAEAGSASTPATPAATKASS
jgi:hypothetical protein